MDITDIFFNSVCKKILFLISLFIFAGLGCARQVDYQVYDPSIEYGFIYNPENGPLSYNHDSSIEYFRGRFYAGWNGNTNDWEAREGQKNYWAVSDDGLNWSEHMEFKNVPVFGSPNWQTEWQPNLLNYKPNDELWALWTKSGGFIHSVLSEDGTHWQHNVVFEKVVVKGTEYFLFPTQEPLVLDDGTVLVPTVFRETSGEHSERQYFCGTVLTRDGGKSWQVPEESLVAHPEDTGPLVWEPMFVRQIDGRIRMFFRNEKRYEQTDKMLFSSLGNEDGTVFGPPQYSDIRTICSRMWLGRHGQRRVMLHHDSARNLFSQDRINISLFTSHTGRDDFVAGVSLTGEEVNVCYPQAVIVNDSMYMCYTSGAVPRAIKTARITPLPDKDKYYIMPRYMNRGLKIDNAPRIAVYEKSQTPGIKEVQLYAGHYNIRSRQVNDLGDKSITLTGWIRQRPQNVGVIINALSEDGKKGFSLKEDWFDKLVLKIGGKDHVIGRKELYGDRYVRKGFYMWRDNTYRFFALVIDNEAGKIHYWQDNKLLDEDIVFPKETDLSSGRDIYFARPELQEIARNHYPFYGGMAEVNIYDRKLTAGQIRHLYNKYAAKLGAEAVSGNEDQPVEAYCRLNAETLRDEKQFYKNENPLGTGIEHFKSHGKEMLRFRGNSSAGVELPAYDPDKETVEITLPVKVEKLTGPQMPLISFADDRLRLVIERSSKKLQLQTGDKSHETVSLDFEKSNRIVLNISPRQVIIRNGWDVFVQALESSLSGRFYLGDGYPEGYIAPIDSFVLDVSGFKVKLD